LHGHTSRFGEEAATIGPVSETSHASAVAADIAGIDVSTIADREIGGVAEERSQVSGFECDSRLAHKAIGSELWEDAPPQASRRASAKAGGNDASQKHLGQSPAAMWRR